MVADVVWTQNLMTLVVRVCQSDSSHGWAKVPKSLLKELGIEKSVSSYSYMRDDYAYLEEDCDLALFVKTWETNGNVAEFRFHKQSLKGSKIRSYLSYKPPKP